MLNPFLCCPGRGAGNSTQRVTEVTGGNLALVCRVRQEKVEISALNQKCDKSTGGVQGEGGLVHWLPVPPVPGLPPHQASVAGTTVLPGGWVLLVACLSFPRMHSAMDSQAGHQQSNHSS